MPTAPSITKLFATACLLGFVGYRKRRSVLALWKSQLGFRNGRRGLWKGPRAAWQGQIAHRLWFLGFLVFAGLAAAVNALSAGSVRR
jgi:hypothetical protein